MKRRIFNTLTIVSLILSIATAGLWVRSYSRAYLIILREPNEHQWNMVFTVVSGKLLIAATNALDNDFDSRWNTHDIDSPQGRGLAVFSKDVSWFDYWEQSSGGSAYTLNVPFWFVLVLMLIPAALWTGLRVRKRKRQSLGHCQFCGYDLRATPELCPECGTVPAASMR